MSKYNVGDIIKNINISELEVIKVFDGNVYSCLTDTCEKITVSEDYLNKLYSEQLNYEEYLNYKINKNKGGYFNG